MPGNFERPVLLQALEMIQLEIVLTFNVGLFEPSIAPSLAKPRQRG